MGRQVIWQYGTSGASGSGDNQLYSPYSAVELESGNVLIADRSNHRVIEVDRNRQVIWQYGTSGVSGSGDNQLYYPVSAVELTSGNVLITDTYNRRVIEVDR